MATQAKTNLNQQASRATKVQQYVDHQLERTRRQVKAFDLITSFIGLVACVIAFFLLAAVVDAWIWPLGTTGRVIALGTLIVGIMAYCLVTLVPLFLRRINPAFAAKMIEDAKPTFKNSLINYLALRKSPKAAHRAVVDAVARRAASDLQTVPEDATVDRSNLIRVGFILVGIAVAAVAYMIFSPKNPLQTVGRILAPTAKMAKPAVVQITEVSPGDTQVFFGDKLMVSAKVKGRHDPNDVKIVFTTTDGQLVDSQIPMEPAAAGRYTGELKTDTSGIQQPLRYHVVARDGVSPEYAVNVRPNPTITVGSVEITPPRYTKLPERIVEGQGDIQALEGSEININAHANLPISLAYIELLTPQNENISTTQYKVVQTIEMSSEGQDARGSFWASLNSKRTRPQFTHYRIRFVSTEDDRNESPNIYPVRITPDLAPEIAIVNPVEKARSIPANQKLVIEVEANDLDFEISSIDLHIDHQGSKVFDRDLKLETIRGNQRVASRYELIPEKLNLKPGDRAEFFATASDNRTSQFTGQLEPNISATETYTLVITAPREEKQEQPQDPEQKAPEQDDSQDEDSNPGDNEQDDPNKDPQNSDADGDSEKQPDQSNGEQDKGDSQEDEMADPESESGDSSQQGNQGDQSTGDESQSGDSTEQGNEGTEEGQQSSDQQETDSQQSSGDEGEQADGSEGEGQQGGSSNSETEAQSGDQQDASEGNSGDSESGQGMNRNGDNETGDGESESGNSSNSQSSDAGQQNGAESDGQGNPSSTLR